MHLHLVNSDEFVEHRALAFDVLSLKIVRCKIPSTVTLVSGDLLLNHTLTELELVDTVDETFLRDELARSIHRHALYGGCVVLARVEHIF